MAKGKGDKVMQEYEKMRIDIITFDEEDVITESVEGEPGVDVPPIHGSWSDGWSLSLKLIQNEEAISSNGIASYLPLKVLWAKKWQMLLYHWSFSISQ